MSPSLTRHARETRAAYAGNVRHNRNISSKEQAKEKKMGNRSNINFTTSYKHIGDTPVYGVLNVYLHNGGTTTLLTARKHTERSTDYDYFTNPPASTLLPQEPTTT